MARPPGARGDACSSKHSSASGLACAPLSGGYCACACGVTGSPCDGACAQTGRLGELCAKHCTSDADCRTGMRAVAPA
ncbi:MAG TPA: hypothetical protein VFS15_04995 [Kofleriaceae bacterium]|nr:hypothetical protein [Kofleriaceae bacterium]